MRSMKEWNPSPMTEQKKRPNPSTHSNEFRSLMLLPLITIGFVLAIALILM